MRAESSADRRPDRQPGRRRGHRPDERRPEERQTDRRDGDRDELVRALVAVHDGGSVVDPPVVDALLAAGRRSDRSPVRSLSARELDVLRGVAEGRTNGAIAAHLHVSESAVSKHVAAIFAKLGLHESAQIDRRVSAVLTWVEHRAGQA